MKASYGGGGGGGGGGGQEGASPPCTNTTTFPQMFLCLCCIVYSKMLTLTQIWGYKAFEQTFPQKHCRALCMHEDVTQPNNVAIIFVRVAVSWNCKNVLVSVLPV